MFNSNWNQGDFPHQTFNQEALSQGLIAENQRLYGELYNAKAMLADLLAPYLSLKKEFVWKSDEALWVLQRSDGKSTRIASIQIYLVILINVREDGTMDGLYVEFVIKNKLVQTYIPFDDFRKRRVMKHFFAVDKYADATETQFQELLFYLMKNPINNVGFLNIPQHPGWYGLEILQPQFVTSGSVIPVLQQLYPSCITRREAFKLTWSEFGVMKRVGELVAKHWKIGTALGFRGISLIASILKREYLLPHLILCVCCRSRSEEDKIAALLNTEHYETITTTSLNCASKDLHDVMTGTNDGIALFRDTSLAEDARKLQNALNHLLNYFDSATLQVAEVSNLIAVISRFAGSMLPSESTFLLEFNDYLKDYSAAAISQMMNEFDAVLINKIRTMLSSADGQSQFINLLADCSQNLPAELCGEKRTCCIALAVMHKFLNIQWGMQLFDDEGFHSLIKCLAENRTESIVSTTIVDDFTTVLNDSIISHAFELYVKDGHERIALDQPFVVSFENHICIPIEVFEEELLPRLTTSHNPNTVIREMNDAELLYATKRNRHPLSVHDEDGKTRSICTYAFSQAILDDDIVDIINQSPYKSFFIKKEEAPQKFLPLITGANKTFAGKQISSFSNNHILVTGLSGYGKTTALATIAMGYSRLGYKVLMFDSSRSFPRKQLSYYYGNCEIDFLDNFVCFIHLEDKIPMNLWDVSAFDRQSSRCNALAGLISSMTDELSFPQLNMLKRVIRPMVEEQGKNVQPEEIIDQLKECEGQSAEALINRLEPVFEELREYGMESATSWDTFISNTKGITVFSLDASFSDHRKQIFDLMLAALYNQALRELSYPIVLVFDEMQGQNLSELGPIQKMMDESRKLNIAVVGATQPYRKRGDDVCDVMRNADTKIFVKPTDDSIEDVAKTLRYGKKKAECFDQMNENDVIISSPFYDKDLKRNAKTILRGEIVMYSREETEEE